ncbi:hypothetical protein KIW84_072841 [Lathyrus oleraceus]|uniref:Uncharacterized protein n=1 Tax=Pisum sativum TaxID=3888 RepID=A0A9D4VP88_PEA|nr:hypothetical protein KIW84_072841 [Pisum sativum]
MQVGGYDCPFFVLSEAEEKRIQRPWRRGVIVKLLGRKIGHKALETRLKQMWGRFSHYREGCPENKNIGGDKEDDKMEQNSMKKVQRGEQAGLGGGSAGLWKVVQKQRKGKKLMNDRKGQLSVIVNVNDCSVGSRFVALSEEIPYLNGVIKDNHVTLMKEVLAGKNNGGEKFY